MRVATQISEAEMIHISFRSQTVSSVLSISFGYGE